MSYCFEDLPDHQYNECNYPKGGISGIGVLLSGHGITDFSSAAEWQTAINNGLAKIIKKIKAELPEPSPVEGENVVACGSETILDGFDYEFTIQDYNVNSTNDLFYSALNKVKSGGITFYMCEEDMVRTVERQVTFVSRLFIPRSNKEKQHYLITAKWSQPVDTDFPALSLAPDGIFDYAE